MDLMDLDHNMELDIDLVPDEPIVPEPDPGNRSRSPGEIDDDADARCPSKVYIKGLDAMNPHDVKSYVAQHCSDSDVELEQIEWIDDSSANLLFASADIASRALAALAAEPIPDISQLPLRHLLPAKPFLSNPELVLRVRPSLECDKKTAGSAARSRFYLLNPEYDPEERRRRSEARRYRNRDSDSARQRRGRQAQTNESEALFDVNLYDDGYNMATVSAKARPRRKRSLTPDYNKTELTMNSYPHSNRGRELFPDSVGSRHKTPRDRSASPGRDRDGDQNMNEPVTERPIATWEQNRHKAQAIKSRISRQNRTKELFPTEAISDSGRLGDKVEDVATLLSKGIMLPLMDGSNDTAALSSSSRKFEDRVTVPGRGKLADRVTTPDSTGTSAFNIRGAASQKNSQTGFTIKGSAGKSVKELFPDRFGGNTGKELFGNEPGARPRQRQRAGDLFD